MNYWPPNGNLADFIREQFPPEYQGWAVDVGASDGISINTTYHLEKAHRWNVLSVDANPDYAKSLKQHRMFVEICACSHEPGEATFHIHEQNPEAFSSLKPNVRPDLHTGGNITWKKVKVRVETVDRLLKKWDFPRLDVLCVDTEGTELDVLRGCSLHEWKPKVIVTECWDKVGPIDLYLEGLGYVKTARNVHNDVFILKEAE